MSVLTLLAHDPVLPMRDRLLDPAMMCESLGEVICADGPVLVEDYVRGRVKYRVGASLRVLHRFRVNGVPVSVASRTFPAGRSARVFADADRGESVGSLRAVAHVPELETVFWTFPCDRKLSGLPALLGGDGLLDRMVGQPVSTTLVQYAPEKAATVACAFGGGRDPVAYAKAYADVDEGERARLIHDHLPRMLDPVHPKLGLPGFVGYDARQRVLVVEAVGGTRMDALRGRALLDGVSQLGAAVGTLHRIQVPPGIPRFARLDPGQVVTAAELIGQVRPDVAERAQELATELVLAYTPPVRADACLHGDVHPKNGILRNGRVVLIDLDQVATGPSAAELGSFRAALRYRAVTGQARRGEVAQLEAAFLDGFGAVRSLPTGDEIRWYTAAALLTERALRAVNRIRPDGLRALDLLLDEARRELRGPA